MSLSFSIAPFRKDGWRWARPAPGLAALLLKAPLEHCSNSAGVPGEESDGEPVDEVLQDAGDMSFDPSLVENFKFTSI